MKPLPTFALAALLAGCQALEPALLAVPDTPCVEERRETVSDWLLKRQKLCELEADEQRARLRGPGGGSEGKAIERVLLASCEPERTPGLLREALHELPSDPDRDPALQALLDMIRDHARSYRLLEDRNAQLAVQLEATIEGIRQIESDMENMRRNRRTP